MIVKTELSKIYFYREKYDSQNMPDTGIRLHTNCTVYWYKYFEHDATIFKEFDSIDDVKLLLEYLDSEYNSFQNNSFLENDTNIVLDFSRPHIHLNKFVPKIKCDLPFTVIGWMERCE